MHSRRLSLEFILQSAILSLRAFGKASDVISLSQICHKFELSNLRMNRTPIQHPSMSISRMGTLPNTPVYKGPP